MPESLDLDALTSAQPGTGEIMASVGRCYAACWHAAHGGNWDLAAYFLRRVRGLQRRLMTLRAKYREQLTAFERDCLEPLFAAIDARDLLRFDRLYERGVAEANRYHVLNDKPYIRWKRPDRPPEDLDLGSG
jgi:hypothetical protein